MWPPRLPRRATSDTPREEPDPVATFLVAVAAGIALAGGMLYHWTR